MSDEPTNRAADGLSGTIRGLYPVLLILCCLAAYSNTYDVPFTFDDLNNIVQNGVVREKGPDLRFFYDIEGVSASRPLMLFTFSLDNALWGLNTAGYHAINILLHSVNTLLFYLLFIATAGLVLKNTELPTTETQVQDGAFFAALFYCLHPLQTEAVTYIISRSTLLALFFALSALLVLSRSIGREKAGPLSALGVFVLCLLGVSSRESFVAAPLLMLLYDYCFSGGFGLKKIFLARRLKIHLAAWCTLLYLFYLVTSYEYQGAGLERAGAGPVEYFMTQWRVLFTYLRLIVLPVGQNIDYDYPVYGEFIINPSLILSLAGYLGVWGLAAYFYIKKKPVLLFALLWFMLWLLPTTSIMPLRDVIFEHRLYAALAGPCAAAGIGIIYVSGKKSFKATAALYAICILISAILFSLTHLRNEVWRDPVALWNDAVNKSPLKARPYHNLGDAYRDIQDIDGQLASYGRAFELDPQRARSSLMFARALEKKGMLNAARKQYETTIELDSGMHIARFNLALLLRDSKSVTESLEHFSLLIDSWDDNPVVIAEAEKAYALAGRTATAKQLCLRMSRLANTPKAAREALRRCAQYRSRGPGSGPDI